MEYCPVSSSGSAERLARADAPSSFYFDIPPPPRPPADDGQKKRSAPWEKVEYFSDILFSLEIALELGVQDNAAQGQEGRRCRPEKKESAAATGNYNF